VHAEHLALRDAVALEDTTAQGTLEVSGPGACEWLDGLVVGSLDVIDGGVVPTWMLAPNGGVGDEVTVIRLAADRLWVLAGVGRQHRDEKWLADHLPADGTVALRDVSSAWCSVGVWGPRSDELIASVAGVSGATAMVGVGGMGAWSSASPDIAGVPSILVRTPRLGDGGWEIFAPFEQGLRLWDTLWEAGAALGLVAAGHGVSSIGARQESGLASRAWELVSGYDLVEAGLDAPAKARDFVGKAAYLEQLGREPAARLCRLVVEDHRSPSAGALRYPLGGEPVLTRSGELLVDARGRRSFATSAGSVPPLGQHRLFAYLPPEHAADGAELALEYFGEPYPVRVVAVGAVPPASLG